jgi:hypothetical protein
MYDLRCTISLSRTFLITYKLSTFIFSICPESRIRKITQISRLATFKIRRICDSDKCSTKLLPYKSATPRCLIAFQIPGSKILQTINYKSETISKVFITNFSIVAIPSFENCLVFRLATIALMLRQ